MDYPTQIHGLPIGDPTGNLFRMPSPYNVAAQMSQKRGDGQGLHNSNLDNSFQRDAYGLTTTANNLNMLLPEELRPASRQSNFKKQCMNKSISGAQNPIAGRISQKKKRSAMYVTNDSAGSRRNGQSRNSRQLEPNGTRPAPHSGSCSRKSKNMVIGS